MFRRICAWVLMASPAVAFGADNATLQLQRDLASLQEQVRNLQKSQDDKFAAMLEQLKQVAGSASDASKSAAALQQNLKTTQDQVVTPVAQLASRMDQMSSDLSRLSNAVTDLTASLAKMQTQMTDLINQVKVIQTPPAPPQTTAAPGAAAASPAVPPISATDLYNNADRDRNGGNYDLAVNEFSEFLKYYPDSPQAPSAQFYIGWIHYGSAHSESEAGDAASAQKDYQAAADDFDNVAKNYPDDATRVPEAMYYRGMSLEHVTGHKTAAADVYIELIKRFPKTGGDYAAKACTQLKGLGKNCPAVTSSKPSAARKK